MWRERQGVLARRTPRTVLPSCVIERGYLSRPAWSQSRLRLRVTSGGPTRQHGVMSLAGRLLVAAPVLRDPNFDRTVVLMLSHDEDGAMGVVVNRPTDVPITSILPDWQPVVSEPDVVFKGGPVSLDSALGLAALVDGDEPLGARRVIGRLAVVDLDAPPELVSPAVLGMRVFAGYAGWSPDQLEAEIEEGAWYVVDAEASDAFSQSAEDLWRAVLRRQPGPLSWMADFPPDPSLN